MNVAELRQLPEGAVLQDTHSFSLLKTTMGSAMLSFRFYLITENGENTLSFQGYLSKWKETRWTVPNELSYDRLTGWDDVRRIA